MAEAIQTLPQLYESEELKEGKKLEFHWTIAETKWSDDLVKEEKISQVKENNGFLNMFVGKRD